MSFAITSSAFKPHRAIPKRYTCDDKDISPPLNWTGIPQGTQSLVLIVDDPDAPDPEAPKMTWVHWILYNLPHDSDGIPEAVEDNNLPSGTLPGINSWNLIDYGGPCPPVGQHRYFFKLYALDCSLPDLNHPDKDTLLESMQGHVIEQTVLMGTYQH